MGARRWSLALRVIEGIPVDRARVRFTAVYALRNDLTVGVEVNPKDDDVGLLVNWRALDETARRPALILGTSSDRIGTTSGRAYYATLSKDVESWTGLPIAPYVGTAFGEFEDEWELIGGVRVRWAKDWSSTHLWDGDNLHHLLDRRLSGGRRVGLVVAEQDGEHYAGVSLGLSF
jgi:hypothetical protein